MVLLKASTLNWRTMSNLPTIRSESFSTSLFEPEPIISTISSSSSSVRNFEHFFNNFVIHSVGKFSRKREGKAPIHIIKFIKENKVVSHVVCENQNFFFYPFQFL